jgi:hypothetical protein
VQPVGHRFEDLLFALPGRVFFTGS